MEVFTVQKFQCPELQRECIIAPESQAGEGDVDNSLQPQLIQGLP